MNYAWRYLLSKNYLQDSDMHKRSKLFWFYLLSYFMHVVNYIFYDTN
jgi:hypothetical protein